jgi:hypothetical protein
MPVFGKFLVYERDEHPCSTRAEELHRFFGQSSWLRLCWGDITTTRCLGDTIRRDLEELAEEGCLTRVHGGARSIGSNHGVMVAREYTTPEKHRYHMGEKREIARSASQLSPMVKRSFMSGYNVRSTCP